MKPLRKIAAASAAAAALCLAQGVTAAACDEHDPAASFTASVRSSTAKYLSLTVAKKAGYSILADTAGNACIAEPGMGAMGVHYVKDDLVKDPAIDPKEPEALVYAPDENGRLRLAALEYVVIQGDWNARHIPPANLSARAGGPGEHSAAVAFRARVQLHRRAQQVRSPAVLLVACLALGGQPRRDQRDVEPQRAL